MPTTITCPVCRSPFVAYYPGRRCCSETCAKELKGSWEDRFWARINRKGPTQDHMVTPCHVWTGRLEESGYARIRQSNRERIFVHRAVWLLVRGPIPEGLFVLHHCDLRHCVNAEEHLFLGTTEDNAQDMLQKGRGNKAKGASHGLAKRTEEEIVSLLREYEAGGMTVGELSKKYDLSHAQTSRIVSGKRWAHLQERAS